MANLRSVASDVRGQTPRCPKRVYLRSVSGFSHCLLCGLLEPAVSYSNLRDSTDASEMRRGIPTRLVYEIDFIGPLEDSSPR
jgi:hypothetical protein